MSEIVPILGLTADELILKFKKMELPAFRAKQVLNWIYQKKVFDFEQMTDLPAPMRNQLKQKFVLSVPTMLQHQISNDGTRKMLLELKDKRSIEVVILNDDGRLTMCISSQVGCAMGCRFCATATQKLERHLDVSEIIGEFMVALKMVNKIDNLVFMGMGEPLHNFDNVVKAIRILNDPAGLEFAQRRITVSTSGLEPQIRQLADLKLQITLALSLNATIDDLRTEIMPVNKRFNLAALKSALRYYNKQTGRKVTLEYVLLDGFNTHKQEARGIVKFSKGIICNVNLIPFNPFEGSRYKRPDNKVVKEFRSILEAENVPVAVRTTRGMDIDAACGQLRTKFEMEKTSPEKLAAA
jgi:23S rRNA (adenine2503-C2)-methyltransferase